MFVDNEYCFDPKSQGWFLFIWSCNETVRKLFKRGYVSIEYCNSKQKPLLQGRTVFFAVQPKFMNVNIRINLDVTKGAVHVYLSPKDDTFVVKPDGNTWMHKVNGPVLSDKICFILTDLIF